MFDQQSISLKETVEARKQKIEGDAAWELISSSDEVIVSRGKKIETFHPANDPKEDILKAVSGRTGNLRAPALKTGQRMLIGFNNEMYSRYLT